MQVILAVLLSTASVWRDGQNYAILCSLPPQTRQWEGGVSMSATSFILSIMAGVIANYVSKRLDEREHDGDEPRY